MLEFSPEKRDLSRKNLENVEAVIVDEFSMVSADNLYRGFSSNAVFWAYRETALEEKFLSTIY